MWPGPHAARRPPLSSAGRRQFLGLRELLLDQRQTLVPEIMRSGVKILDREIARQQFAVAVDQIGARGDGAILETGVPFAAQKRHIHQAESDQREKSMPANGGKR